MTEETGKKPVDKREKQEEDRGLEVERQTDRQTDTRRSREMGMELDEWRKAAMNKEGLAAFARLMACVHVDDWKKAEASGEELKALIDKILAASKSQQLANPTYKFFDAIKGEVE